MNCQGPNIASVNRAWTDPLKTYYYWQKTYYYWQKTYYYREPSVNRAWNLRKHFKFGNLRKKSEHFFRETATNLLCKSPGMSVLLAFHCKLERPVRGCDLKVIEKNVAFQWCSNSFKWGSSQIQHWTDIVFGCHLWLWYHKNWGCMGAQWRPMWKKLGDDEREEKNGWALSNRGKPKVLVKLGL